MASSTKKSKQVKGLRTKALTSKQAKTVKGGADLLPAAQLKAQEVAVKLREVGAGMQKV